MTRLWPEGLPLTVQANGAGQPQTFTWQGKRHPIDTITRDWRLDLEWWRQRVWRAYFKVSTTTGLVVVLYQDLATGAWCLQRLYD